MASVWGPGRRPGDFYWSPRAECKPLEIQGVFAHHGGTITGGEDKRGQG